MANAKEIRTIYYRNYCFYIAMLLTIFFWLDAGNVITTLISLSRMPRFMEIYKKKSVGDYVSHRHVGLVMIYSLWFLYGLPLIHKDSILVTTSNGIRFVIEVIYVVVFLVYSDDKSRRDYTYKCLGCGLLLVAYVYLSSLYGLESLSDRQRYVGVVCNVLTTMDLLIAPCYDFEYAPVRFYLASFINAGIWIAYSLIYKVDIFVLISSCLGMLLYASQLIFCSREATIGSEESVCTLPPFSACQHSSTPTVNVVAV